MTIISIITMFEIFMVVMIWVFLFLCQTGGKKKDIARYKEIMYEKYLSIEIGASIFSILELLGDNYIVETDEMKYNKHITVLKWPIGKYKNIDVTEFDIKQKEKGYYYREYKKTTTHDRKPCYILLTFENNCLTNKQQVGLDLKEDEVNHTFHRYT